MLSKKADSCVLMLYCYVFFHNSIIYRNRLQNQYKVFSVPKYYAMKKCECAWVKLHIFLISPVDARKMSSSSTAGIRQEINPH